jgi:tetratricopeptide (TPR) repeat protein
MTRLGWALALGVALATTALGCFQGLQQGAAVASEGRVCAKLVEIEQKDGNKTQRPQTTIELVLHGDRLRDEGLYLNATAAFGRGSSQMFGALDCYGRALALAPEHYGANLGLGVTYLALAKQLDEKPESERVRSMLQSAKKSLARAYALRRGHFEPVFYLAEIAAFEEDYQRARGYIEAIQKAGTTKLGPVEALLGSIAERQGNKEEAKQHYEAAFRSGGPVETLYWVSQKVKINLKN